MFGGGALMDHAERVRKRSGHLLSKMRFVSAQLLAYIEDGLWLRLASHANAQAAQFAAAVEQHAQANLEFPVEANEVFVRWNAAGFQALEAAGVQFLYWPGHDDLARFVFAHCSSDEATKRLCEILTGIES
jgi:threonine aldolase